MFDVRFAHGTYFILRTNILPTNIPTYFFSNFDLHDEFLFTSVALELDCRPIVTLIVGYFGELAIAHGTNTAFEVEPVRAIFGIGILR
jgi:hypothetical protein